MYSCAPVRAESQGSFFAQWDLGSGSSVECEAESSGDMRGKRTVKRSTSLDEKSVSSEIKKIKVTHPSHGTVGGLVLAFGQGDVGQLGLGEDVIERKRPALVPLPEKIMQVVAGGMHTVCLSESGNVYTFGCNDEGALGRDTSEEGSEAVPRKVDLVEKVVQISAGDSHTAALTADGRVFLIGSFRDNNGVIGLLEPMKQSMVPVQVQMSVPVVKIASGNDHLVLLTLEGDLYTSGCGEQGQLGRVPERFTNRGGRRGLDRLLIPQCVRMRAKGSQRVLFQDAFCGAYFTFAISTEGHVYGFGLANYHQLGTKSTNSCFAPQNLSAFKNSTKSWVCFSGGQHHTVCLDSEGRVYSLGRAEYGRLGLGEGAEEKSEPTVIQGLPRASSVACGASVSYAVAKDVLPLYLEGTVHPSVSPCLLLGDGHKLPVGHRGGRGCLEPCGGGRQAAGEPCGPICVKWRAAHRFTG